MPSISPESCTAFSFLILTFGLTLCSAQYEDVRCKCICPAVSPQNGTVTKSVFIGNFKEPGSCTCENVVKPMPDIPNFCDTCECQWQRRNTTTIKVSLHRVTKLHVCRLFVNTWDPAVDTQVSVVTPSDIFHRSPDQNGTNMY